MPQVPTSFVPQVGVQGEGANVQFVAPGIAPMENLAAQQQVQLGRATESLGNTVWRIGQIIEDDINTAKAKGAEGAALDAIEGILNGDGGYMYSQGQDADARFTGTEAAIAERVQGAMQGLDNDVQKAMFQQSMSRALTNARSRMNGHRNNEVTKWQAQESDARAKRYVGQAINAFETRNDTGVDRNGNPTGEYATNVRVALEEARKAGRLLGYPEDSEAMRGIQRGVMDGVASGVVGRLIDRTDYNGAMAYLGSIKDQLNPETHERLLSAAFSGQKRAVIEQVASNIINQGRVDSVAGTRPYVIPVPGAKMERVDSVQVDAEGTTEETLVVTAPADSPIHAPYDGKIIAMAQDDEGLSLKIQFDDGRIGYMRGMGKGSEAVGKLYPGKSISRNDVVGVVGDKQFMYSLEENGKPLSVRDVNSVAKPSDRAAMEGKPPMSLREAESMTNLVDPAIAGVSASDVRKEVVRLWNERAQKMKDSYNELLVEADRYSDPFAVPEHIWSQLSPKDQQVRMDKWRETNDLNVITEYAISPGSFDVQRVLDLRQSLTESTYRRMLNEVSTGANKAAQADAQLLQSSLIRNGLDSLAFPEKDADKAARTLLFQAIEEDLAAERARGEVKPERRQEIIDKRMMEFGEREGSWLWNTGRVKPMPLAAMTPEQRRLMDADLPSDPAARAAMKQEMGYEFIMAQGLRVPKSRYDAIVAALRQEGAIVTPARIRAEYQLELDRARR